MIKRLAARLFTDSLGKLTALPRLLDGFRRWNPRLENGWIGGYSGLNKRR